tara:strand:- start:2443 stop:2787 length:345 start_codon:yes stop_codon:yes gene_type:complete
MAFTQENVLGTHLSGFTNELVTLSTDISQDLQAILDNENNVYVLDQKSLYFGNDKDFNISLTEGQETLQIEDNNNNPLFGVNKDGSINLKATDSDMEVVNGNLTYRADGLYVYI